MTPRPLTPIEQRFYQAWRLSPDSPKHNISIIFRIQGPLDSEQLRHAIQQYAQQIQPEVLAHIEEKGHGPEWVGQAHTAIDWRSETVDTTPLQTWISRHHSKAYDWHTGPLLRIRLRVIDPEHHVLFVGWPHVLSDLITQEIFCDAIAQLYQNHPYKPGHHLSLPQHKTHASTPPPPVHATTLPQQTDQAAPHDHWHVHCFSEAERSAIKRNAKSLHTTPFLWLTSLWTWCLAHWSHDGIAQVAYAIDTRPPGPSQPGCFVAHRTLTISADVTKASTLASAAKTSYRGPLQHDPLPNHLVSQSPIQQTRPHIPGLHIEAIPITMAHCLADTWLALECRDEFVCALIVNEKKHSSAQAQHWLHTFVGWAQHIDTLKPPPHAPTKPRHHAPQDHTALPSWTPDSLNLRLKKIWEKTLGHPIGSTHLDWHDLGGTSSQMLALINAINQHFDDDLPISWLMRHPTIAEQARALRTQTHGRPSIVQTYQQGKHATLVLVHPGAAGIEVYDDLMSALGPDITIIGIDNPHLNPTQPHFSSIEAMASNAIQGITPLINGPLFLAGWSMGGIIAHAMASKCPQVDGLFLLDSQLLSAGQIRLTLPLLQPQWIGKLIHGRRGKHVRSQSEAYRAQIAACARHECHLLLKHTPTTHQTPTVLFRAQRSPYRLFNHLQTRYDHGWFPWSARLHIVPMDCNHFTLLDPLHIHIIAKHMTQTMQHVSRATHAPNAD